MCARPCEVWIQDGAQQRGKSYRVGLHQSKARIYNLQQRSRCQGLGKSLNEDRSITDLPGRKKALNLSRLVEAYSSPHRNPRKKGPALFGQVLAWLAYDLQLRSHGSKAELSEPGQAEGMLSTGLERVSCAGVTLQASCKRVLGQVESLLQNRALGLEEGLNLHLGSRSLGFKVLSFFSHFILL